MATYEVVDTLATVVYPFSTTHWLSCQHQWLLEWPLVSVRMPGELVYQGS
jgi:hypothetical protein